MGIRIVVFASTAMLFGCASFRDYPSMDSPSPTQSLSVMNMAYSAAQISEDVVDVGETGLGIGHTLLMYIPNRLLDLLDIVRLRLRVGPGFGLGVRLTEFADVYLGAYASVWAGLPGARNRKTPRLPVGVESKSGVEVGPADATLEGMVGPDYSTWEVGFDFQFILLGIAIGLEPYEALDFVLGLLTLDPKDDDL